MSARRSTYIERCAEPGCGEIAYHEFESMRERAEWFKIRGSRKFLCSRHARPDEVLSRDNSVRHFELTVYAETYGQFWRREDGRSGSGLETGPGFKAWAKDFPVGTKLLVTAEVELPAAGEVSA